MAPDYRDEDFYVDKLVVADKNLITASGLGCVEFACEIIRRLDIYSSAEINAFFEMFKNAVIPSRYSN